MTTDVTISPPADGPLVRYEAACRAVAEARRVDEVQAIAANADMLRAYAKQAKNKQLELDAAEIRIRAERRIGELMASQAATVGTATGARGIGTSAGYDETRTLDCPPTLAEAGIDKNLAHRARTLAAVPDEKFEELLDDKRRSQDSRVVLISGASRALSLKAENEALSQQVAALKQRVAQLLEEKQSLKDLMMRWKERALQLEETQASGPSG